MAANDEKKSADGVMDVAKPGTSAPDTSARPIIVSHKPMVKDPMMATKTELPSEVEAESEPKPQNKPAANTSRQGMTIEPRAELKAQTDKKEKEKGETIQVTSKTPAKEEPAKIADQPEKPAEAEKETKAPTSGASSEAGVVGAVASEAETKKQEQQLSAEEQARRDAVQKLVDEKRYFLPISKARSQTAKHVFMTVLILLLVAAIGLELAIDAGLVDVGIPPVVDLIKN